MASPNNMKGGGWTADEVDMIEQMKRVCVINMFVQSSSAHIFDVAHNLLTIPNIVVGGVMSVSLFSTDCGKTKVAAGVLAIVSTILSSLTKQISAGERAQQHCFVVKEYHSLIRNIDVTMTLDKRDPYEKEKFIRDVQLELDRLYMVQPEPSWLAIRWFEKRYKNIEVAFFPEIERYAAGVMGRASKGPSALLSVDYDNSQLGMRYNLRRGAFANPQSAYEREISSPSRSYTGGSAFGFSSFPTLAHESSDTAQANIKSGEKSSSANNQPATFYVQSPLKSPFDSTLMNASKQKQPSTVAERVSNAGTCSSFLLSSPLAKKASWAIGNTIIGYGIITTPIGSEPVTQRASLAGVEERSSSRSRVKSGGSPSLSTSEDMIEEVDEEAMDHTGKVVVNIDLLKK
jgi:hypothetical protein